jgi:hypothetical protein
MKLGIPHHLHRQSFGGNEFFLKVGKNWRKHYPVAVRAWLPLRDSNPDMLLQRQLSYH